VRYEGLDIGEGITDHPIEVTGEGFIDLHFAHIGVVGIIDGIK
jgi:hypothetical protein